MRKEKEKKEETGKKKKVSSEKVPAPVVEKKSQKDKAEKKSRKSKEKNEEKEKKREESVSKSKKKKGEKVKSEKKKKRLEKKQPEYEQETVPANESLGNDQPDIDTAGNADAHNKNDVDEYDEEDAGNASGSASKAFQRVKAEDWLGKKGSWDNSYEGTFGQAGWGFKAQQTLGKVRGKDFRHEKTKKKRGSYRGGAIDPHAVCSYKFDSDDD